MERDIILEILSRGNINENRVKRQGTVANKNVK